MIKNKKSKGFISTSVVYCLLIIFLLLLLMLLMFYNNSRMVLTRYQDSLKNFLIEENSHINQNISIYFWHKSTGNSYDYVKEIPTGASYISSMSSCSNGTVATYNTTYKRFTLKVNYEDIASEYIECNFYFQGGNYAS